jgi:signal peptidase I
MEQDPIISVGPANSQEPEESKVVTGEEAKTPSAWRSALSTIAILIAAPLIALFLTAFVFQSYEVDGPSMETTLQNRDRLIVWKVPRTISRIIKKDYAPARGDVVVFVKHGLYEEGSNAEKQLIKRVVGIPGDRVVVQDNQITIYNSEHPNGYNPDLGEDFSSTIIQPTTGDDEVTVGKNEVYVVGDNRGNSLDSRSFGVVSTHDIVGRMVLRIYPIGSLKSFI